LLLCLRMPRCGMNAIFVMSQMCPQSRGDMAGTRDMARNLLMSVLLLAFMPVFRSTVSAVRLPDGTPVPVRLLRFIDSESSMTGDPVPFEVTRDVVFDGVLLIARGTPVIGVVVKARPAHVGFLEHLARLAFTFTQTTAGDGQVIRLRATVVRSTNDRVVLERSPHHDLQWAGEGNTFNAYVDGDYEILAKSEQTTRRRSHLSQANSQP
jgi:hypothetical protein